MPAALEKAGRDTMRMPAPGAAQRKRLPALLKDAPGLAVVIDSFEQNPTARASAAGVLLVQEKAHTLKSPVAVDQEPGALVDVSDSVPGR